MDGVADLRARRGRGGLAHGLDDQRDGARLGVGVGDGQRDALGALAPADDDELPGLADLGDAAASMTSRETLGDRTSRLTTGCIAPFRLPLVAGRPSDPGAQATASLRSRAGNVY